MLISLHIRNFVLIDELRLDLDKGLNVLTGETGAGKSIVLDALGLLLGERFAVDSVRQGAEKSEIDGIFDAPRDRAFRRWWEDHGWAAGDEIVIRREGDVEGRSRAFLNDRPVTLATLQELRGFLVDVHGQNEHQLVLKPAIQLASLDRFAGLENSTAAIAPLYSAWREAHAALSARQISEEERLQRLDMIQFQLQELESAKLQVGEEESLDARLPELKNAERLRALAETAYDVLYSSEGSALERLGQAEKALTSLVALTPSVAALAEELAELRARAEDVAHNLQDHAERWQADPAALEAALARQEQLSRLKKKYGATVEAMLERAASLRAELERLENADTFRRELERRSAEARDALWKASQVLSTKRRSASKELGRAVQKELADLGLKQAVFSCRVDVAAGEEAFSSTGMDRVTFEWAPNPGEGMEALRAIASGGEMSRVMLALKTVLAQTDAMPVLVFDEIDAGIGGLTAQAVGRKLRALSRHHQILSVSHLPQIAACAHAHFQVAKRVTKGRTLAAITRLEAGDRLEELARLLGSQVTPTSVQHARELLALNQ